MASLPLGVGLPTAQASAATVPEPTASHQRATRSSCASMYFLVNVKFWLFSPCVDFCEAGKSELCTALSTAPWMNCTSLTLSGLETKILILLALHVWCQIKVGEMHCKKALYLKWKNIKHTEKYF